MICKYIEEMQDEIDYLKSRLRQIKDLAMCGGDCEQDCDHCMQGQIHQLIKEALDVRRDNFDGKDYIKLAEDCIYYAWQNEEISDEELEKTSRAVGLAKKQNRLHKKTNCLLFR